MLHGHVVVIQHLAYWGRDGWDFNTVKPNPNVCNVLKMCKLSKPICWRHFIYFINQQDPVANYSCTVCCICMPDLLFMISYHASRTCHSCGKEGTKVNAIIHSELAHQKIEPFLSDQTYILVMMRWHTSNYSSGNKFPATLRNFTYFTLARPSWLIATLTRVRVAFTWGQCLFKEMR